MQDQQFAVQHQIAQELGVCPAFHNAQEISAETARRIAFLKSRLRDSGLKSYVLGISGGIDSLTAGLLAQTAVSELRKDTGDNAYTFIAMRLPYATQADEQDAMTSINLIAPDSTETVNIASSVDALTAAIPSLTNLSAEKKDFLIGNIKARIRMVAQYAVAGAHQGLVIGTDHAAEALMGFFTKFGDGACDLTPLSGLCKKQVRAIAQSFGVPDSMVYKTPTADLESLKPGLPDEVANGVTYEEIDAFLQGEKVSESAFRIIVDTYRKSAHKRVPPYTP